MRRLRLEDKRRALIFGDGPIGLLTLMLLRHAGAEDVLLVGGRPQRLALARELGAARVLNYHEASGDLAVAVRRAGGGQFSNVVEASGSVAAIQACLDVVTRCGRILVLGDYPGARAGFAWNHLLHQEIELVGSNASAGAWPEAVRIATEDQLPLARLVTHRLPAAQFAKGVELMRSHQADVIKVVLEW